MFPLASSAASVGVLNVAARPTPLAAPATPLPASVLTFQKHAGCAARPTNGHAVAGTHGACPAAPPAQKKPATHNVGVEDVDPAAQPKPGAAAAHAAHAAALVALTADDHVPAAQGLGAVDPAGQKEPGGHGAPLAFDDAPAAAEKTPAGSGVGFSEAKGQNEPPGHKTGAPEEHQYDAGQGVHVRSRTRWPADSVTTTTPAGVTSTPDAVWKRAAEPQPSAHADVSTTPATVVTLPEGVTRRTALPSPTKRLPPASKADAESSEKAAVAAGPSAYPDAPLPANVVTTPAGVTLRMRL